MSKNNKPRIEVHSVGKKYSYGKIYSKSIKEILSGKKYHKEFGEKHLRDSDFWALKDVSFTLHDGETIGVIGPNGAGKSTLLKILSRIVEPSTGHAILRGRITSLLEVGTGFHPELTGRENVYFNGALLGMSKNEITKKFSEIEDFAELGHFIDMPVKYYSSGMRVRLGFSVASHLDAETMLIDEALAVGDARFKKKSLEKMRTNALSGKTVVFVSHQMGQVEEICERSIYLDSGVVKKMGETGEVIEAYLETTKETTASSWENSGQDESEKNPYVRPVSMKITVDGENLKKTTVSRSKNIKLQLEFDVFDPASGLLVGMSLYDENNRRILRSIHADSKDEPKLKKGLNKLSVELPLEILKNEYYYIAFDCSYEGKHWIINPNKTNARIGFLLTGDRNVRDEKRDAMIRPLLDWVALN